jgi:hypothetical protein
VHTNRVHKTPNLLSNVLELDPGQAIAISLIFYFESVYQIYVRFNISLLKNHCDP